MKRHARLLILAVIGLAALGLAAVAATKLRTGSDVPGPEAVLRELEKDLGIAVRPHEGQLLHDLVKEISAKAVTEIGTYRGYSGIWIATALRETGGHLTTYEIDPKVAAVARENFRRAGVNDLITIVIGDAHVEVTKSAGPVDIVFLDADKEGYLDYYEKLLPRVRVGGAVVADNVRMHGVRPYLWAVSSNPNLDLKYTADNKMAISRKLR